MSTRDERIAAAARAQADALARLLASDPRDAAVAAYVPDGPSVDELEALIRQQQMAATASDRRPAA